ncbi:MAG: Flagellar biosynthesis protein FlhB [Pseudolabrys sp.]|jgi:flagellar biosynthetic protein FlhB|nr:Flagellar biosynthesis protein FlhB [Pseudolabrys sp.]
MAEDQDNSQRTEDPTQKRLDEALKRGDVVKSTEVTTWFIIAGGTLVLVSFSGGVGNALTATLRGLVANSYQIDVQGRALMWLAQKIGLELIGTLAIPFILLALAALAGNLIQHRLVWTTEVLAPKLSRISPLAGAKRQFSKQSIANLAKGLVKIIVLGAVMAALLWPERDRLESITWSDPEAILALTRTMALKILGATVALLAVVAAVDYLFQYRQWYERQKMTIRELKDEFKESEGDPAVKGKMKKIRATRMRKRMMAAVPKATVVITNPTHFAVALQYERGMDAPLCVAKGVDAIAFKIREIAEEHRVPVVENPPLARALHATVEIDQPIAAEHYKAVAEVISYVMRLRRAVARR